MRHYGPQIEVRTKADASPVTAADDEAEAIIVEELRRLTPEIAVVSEEAFARGEIPAEAPARFWLVDPLDGTKEFLKCNGEFTVNIALIDDGRPILGVVAAPALLSPMPVPERGTRANGATAICAPSKYAPCRRKA